MSIWLWKRNGVRNHFAARGGAVVNTSLYARVSSDTGGYRIVARRSRSVKVTTVWMLRLASTLRKGALMPMTTRRATVWFVVRQQTPKRRPLRRSLSPECPLRCRRWHSRLTDCLFRETLLFELCSFEPSLDPIVRSDDCRC